MARSGGEDREKKLKQNAAEVAAWTPEQRIQAPMELKRMRKIMDNINSGISVSNEDRADLVTFLLELGRCLGEKDLNQFLAQVETNLLLTNDQSKEK